MILDLNYSREILINILEKFKEYSLKKDFLLDYVNSSNNPYLPEIDLMNDTKNLVVLNMLNFSNLRPRELRSGHFYDNAQEFTLDFNLFFLSYVEDVTEASVNSLKIYELFNEFLFYSSSSVFSFSKTNENDNKYNIDTKVFITELSNLAVNGRLNIKSSKLTNCYSSFSQFRASFKVIEKLKEV